ncbi:MAG: PaaI family thioesterase, partial [Deltaproteobacteria bacterium]|nr:PaaI family thioesterase [Deltaproteobacteria bacterium]
MAEFTPQDPNYQTRVKASFQRQRFMETLGATLVRLEPGVCEIQLAYRPELSQQHGYFHGGLVGTLADNASGYASYTLMG